MPKRKKYPRLPNGFGNIRYLGKRRTNAYAVHPPATDCDEHGNYLRPKALCYVDDWYVGFAVLNAYHAGTYKPGDEILFKAFKAAADTDLDVFCHRLLTDFSAYSHTESVKAENEKTFAEVYEEFFEWKYGEKATKKLSPQSRASTRAAFQNCSALHNRPFRKLRLADLQDCVDACPLKAASIELMVSLIKQMFKYGELYELCDKNYASGLRMPDAAEDEHGVPFSDEDLAVLWKYKADPVIEMILIMCYSGFRISEYLSITVSTREWYFQGGLKTAAGKNRIVPVHSAIQGLVSARMGRFGKLLNISPAAFRKVFCKALKPLGLDGHTPHDCRHTFSRLCEKYRVPEADRKRMLGHSFGTDITNGIYGHRTLDELRESIEMIKVNL